MIVHRIARIFTQLGLLLQSEGQAKLSSSLFSTNRYRASVLVTILFFNMPVLSEQIKNKKDWLSYSSSQQLFKRQDGVFVYFDLELANTTASRSEGLMWRKILPKRAGMLFDFEHSSRIRMWMKNTLVPLDMIFLDEQKLIVYIYEGAEPGNLKIIESPHDARFTVEINAGEVSRYGLSVGDRLLP